MPSPKLIAFAASTREGSFNQSLIECAADALKSAGATVNLLDLADYELPLYSQTIEADGGLPDAAKALKNLFREADGLVISSPEYNSALSPLLKNTIDWCSRAESDDEPPLSAYAGKSALLLAASPGPLGGLRGLYTVRSLFQNIDVTVYPEMLALRSAHEAIADGVITDERWKKKIETLATDYVAFAQKLAG